jgi:hypothetical protein
MLPSFSPAQEMSVTSNVPNGGTMGGAITVSNKLAQPVVSKTATV